MKKTKISGIVLAMALTLALVLGCGGGGGSDSNDGGGSTASKFVSIAGATFVRENAPSSTGGSAPTVTVTGSPSMASGGSGSYSVSFASAAAGGSQVSNVIIAINGDTGYFNRPVPPATSGTVDINISVLDDVSANSLTFNFSAEDGAGGVSAYEAENVVIVHSGGTGTGLTCSGWTAYGSCNFQFCASDDCNTAYYEIQNGTKFDCGGCTDVNNCVDAIAQYLDANCI